MSDGWEPVLENTDADAARDTVRVASHRLRSKAADPEFVRQQPASVGRGHAGFALFHYYVGRELGSQGDLDAAAEWLALAVEAAASEPMSPSLYSGFPGVAWVIAHLQRDSFAPAEDIDLSEVDAQLLRLLRADHVALRYDLISGLVGIGVYCLERLPTPIAGECLEAVVGHLERRSEEGANGRTWFTAPEMLPESARERDPDGRYDLGVAHGVPGVLGLLAGVVRSRESSRARGLLEEGIAWLRSVRLPAEESSGYPYSLDANREPRAPARLAWCYGDPGVATVLLSVARALRNDTLEREGHELLYHSARRSESDAGVHDACLCHGAAGLGHIYNRRHQHSFDATTRNAARQWFRAALDMRELGSGFAGYTFRSMRDGVERREPRVGFLEGTIGVALALLAALGGGNPGWDRLLLLSL